MSSRIVSSWSGPGRSAGVVQVRQNANTAPGACDMRIRLLYRPALQTCFSDLVSRRTRTPLRWRHADLPFENALKCGFRLIPHSLTDLGDRHARLRQLASGDRHADVREHVARRTADRFVEVTCERSTRHMTEFGERRQRP